MEDAVEMAILKSGIRLKSMIGCYKIFQNDSTQVSFCTN
jgi:hypothetical protein